MQVNDSYNIIETEDGSFSLYSKEFDQLMHAREGAYTEALSKHVFPSKILCSNDKVINILDIGFGAGYNPLALIMQTRDKEFEKEFWLMSKDEFLNKYKMLGTGKKHKKIDDFIGNFVALSVGSSIIRIETFLAEGKPVKKSTHCGLTKDEMEVPVIVLK